AAWALFCPSRPTPPLNRALASQTASNGLTYLQSFQRGLNPLIPNLVRPSVASVFPANLTTVFRGIIECMNREATELLKKALSLPVAERADLAGSLIESLDNAE